jgi:hypothetical protein
MKFLLASLKTLNNSKNCPERRIKFLFQCTIAGFRNSLGSQAGFGTTYRDASGYQKAGTTSLK